MARLRPQAAKPSLENRYVFLCAGSNAADAAKVCVAPESRLDTNGLTEQGKQQARQAAARLTSAYNASACDLVLVASDFKDAAETVAILETDLGVATRPTLSPLLRERSYGQFEGGAVEGLVPLLFAKDQQDPSRSTDGAEAVTEVMARTGQVVARLEREHKEAIVVIVAHPGVLQILQTAFIGTKPHHFRQISALQPGELRDMPHSAAQATLPRNPRQYRPSVEGAFAPGAGHA